EGGPVGLPLSGGDRFGDCLNVLLVGGATIRPVHELGVPSVCGVAACHVLGEGDVGVIFDGDAVVIPDDDEVAQLLGAGQRGRLGGDAFLQVAVGGDDIDVVVKRAGA